MVWLILTVVGLVILFAGVTWMAVEVVQAADQIDNDRGE